MKTTNLNIIEALKAAQNEEIVYHRGDSGLRDYILRQTNEDFPPFWGIYRLYAEEMTRTVAQPRPVMEFTKPDLILSSHWEIALKKMDFKEACAYSAKYSIPCKRVGSTARIEIDRHGELWYSSVTPSGGVVRTLNQKDIEAKDWIPA